MSSAGFDSAPDDVVLRTHRQDGVLVVSVHGDVDLATVRPVAAELIGLVACRPDGVVVDMSGVTFLGAIGITLLLDAQQYAEQLGIPFATTTAGRAVLKPLRVTGVDAELRTHETLRGAVSAVRTQIG
ncbi:STAS domain-containing protein [Lentzea tibetensis]|nr:STAS domain-containing protein [Lentzea tibetensis]